MTDETDQPHSISTHDLSGVVNIGNNNTINNYTGQAGPRPAPSPLFSIPAPPANFTGRSAEIEDLLQNFARGTVISGLSGGGGVGKSALARVLAARLADQYPDARIQIDLRGAPHPGQRPLTSEEALQALLRPFHPTTQLPDDLAALQAILTNTLRDKRVLFLLDNARDAAQVRPLIPPAPSAAIMTSRTRIVLTDLGLYTKNLGALRPDEARALLCIHAPLQAASDAELDGLARQCGALPLALNVAAALLAVRPDWTPAHLLKLLADEHTRLRRLKSPDDPNLDVEASLSLSYSLLDDENKRLFRALGIFPAPFDLPALQAIWKLSPEATDDALGPLLHLSLVDYVSGEQMPYKLHDLTRIYAESLLRRQAEEWSALARHHADYFLQQSAYANEVYQQGGENIIQSLRYFDDLWQHLQVAYERSLSNLGQQGVDRWLADFPAHTVFLLTLRLFPAQLIFIFRNALAAAKSLKDELIEAVTLDNLGIAYKNIGELDQAMKFLEERHSIALKLGDTNAEARVLVNIGNTHLDLNNPSKAMEFHKRALSIYRYNKKINDKSNQGNALLGVGNSYYHLDDIKAAIKFYKKALRIYQDGGDLKGQGLALGNLGSGYACLDKAHQATKFYKQALSIWQLLKYQNGEADIYWNMGLLLEEKSQFQRAAELMQICVNYYSAIGHLQATERTEYVVKLRKKAEEIA